MRHAPAKPIPKFLALWKKMIPESRIEFAKMARTTSGNLRQYAEGRREVTPRLAIRIEKVVEKLQLPALTRMDLNETCRNCEYARACVTKGGRKKGPML
jgi:CRISPR/Cas system-associated exonuclease Cas4 (RecB family)